MRIFGLEHFLSPPQQAIYTSTKNLNPSYYVCDQNELTPVSCIDILYNQLI